MTCKVIATVCECVQIGLDEFKYVRTSAVFSTSCQLSEIIKWAGIVGRITNPNISDIKFSIYSE